MAGNVGEVQHKRKKRKADPPTGALPGDGSVVVVAPMWMATIRRALLPVPWRGFSVSPGGGAGHGGWDIYIDSRRSPKDCICLHWMSRLRAPLC